MLDAATDLIDHRGPELDHVEGVKHRSRVGELLIERGLDHRPGSGIAEVPHPSGLFTSAA